MSSRNLNLYFEGNLIGHLLESPQYQVEFTYHSSWLKSKKNFSISHSMPLREETYTQEAQNFFANLLPEGDVRVLVARILGITSENDFRLLEALGGECAGALTICDEPRKMAADYQALNIKKLKSTYENGGSVFSSVQKIVEDIRLSLAGAQDKIPVYFDGKKLFLPQGNSPSSHILKLPSSRFKYLPENEHLMGKLAQAMGLDVASSQLLDLGGLRTYLVERYDRKIVNNKLTRLHQEDFCQALSFSHKVKYEKDGGPKFKDCYECVENNSTDLPKDLDRLIKWMIFNVLVGNCDAHAKNISFLMTAPNEWRLSPHYDLVSTKLYPRISTKLAMSIGSTDDLGTITGTHWGRLAKEIRSGQKWILQSVKEMSEGTLDTFKSIRQEFIQTYGDSPVLDPIEKILKTQSKRLLSQLEK